MQTASRQVIRSFSLSPRSSTSLRLLATTHLSPLRSRMFTNTANANTNEDSSVRTAFRPATVFKNFPAVSDVDMLPKPIRPTPHLTQEETDKWVGGQLVNAGWAVQPGQPKKLSKTFKFKKYKDCVQFTVDLADLARIEKHHPTITLDYGLVKVVTHTHCAFTTDETGSNQNAPGLTLYDIRLASHIDQVYQEYANGWLDTQ